MECGSLGCRTSQTTVSPTSMVSTPGRKRLTVISPGPVPAAMVQTWPLAVDPRRWTVSFSTNCGMLARCSARSSSPAWAWASGLGTGVPGSATMIRPRMKG